MHPVTIKVVEVLSKKCLPEEGLNFIREWVKKESSQKEKSKASCAIRLCRSLIHLGTKSSWHDIAVHIRQFILMYKHRLRLHPSFCKPLMEISEEFGFHISEDGEINTEGNFPAWIDHPHIMEEVFDLDQMRFSKPVIGDGNLFKMKGVSSFFSKEQKALVQASVTMPPGHTLIACLPTGGGKSLISQYPAFLETEGGTIYGGVGESGTTIVVVPTVALAIDQKRSAKLIFNNTLGPEYDPQAYYSGLDVEEREVIYSGLEKGTIPLLFISPEALIESKITSILINAAKSNKINRLVIDEAHIVVDWGNAFRTDFQLLSTFRKKMLQASQGKIKTILMSATLIEWATKILRQLFADEGKLIEIRFDALRTEPRFWIDFSETDEERKKKIISILPLLPRPIILYVTTKEKANDWYESIRKSGFQSLEIFNGDLSSKERERILNDWNKDALDLIVATSAFGMGVDKPDIRCVIHCGLPESINSFYQQVGRGGRDGFASISLTSVVLNSDSDDTFNLIKSSVLKPKTMAERWISMFKSSKFISGDTLELKTNQRPKRLEEQETGRQSANWNEVCLLFLYRAGMIDIVDIKKNEDNNIGRIIIVKLNNIEVLQNEEKVEEVLTPLREEEWNNLKEEFEQMKRMLLDCDSRCISNFFVDTYPNAADQCGGCPSCREYEFPLSIGTPCPEYEGLRKLNFNNYFDGFIKHLLGGNRELTLIYDGIITDAFNFEQKLLNSLINLGIPLFILPNKDPKKWSDFVSVLSKIKRYYTIYEMNEVISRVIYPITGLLAIYYPNNMDKSDHLYQWSRLFLMNQNSKVIHICKEDLFIKSERKNLTELVEGINYPLEEIFYQATKFEDWL